MKDTGKACAVKGCKKRLPLGTIICGKHIDMMLKLATKKQGIFRSY